MKKSIEIIPELHFIFNRQLKYLPVLEGLACLQQWRSFFPESRIVFYIGDSSKVPEVFTYFSRYIDDIVFISEIDNFKQYTSRWFDWEVPLVTCTLREPAVILRNTCKPILVQKIRFSEKYVVLDRSSEFSYLQYYSKALQVSKLLKQHTRYTFPGFYYFPDPSIANIYGLVTTQCLQKMEDVTVTDSWIGQAGPLGYLGGSCLPHTFQESFYGRFVEIFNLPIDFISGKETCTVNHDNFESSKPVWEMLDKENRSRFSRFPLEDSKAYKSVV